jgi:hypothetical protein
MGWVNKMEPHGTLAYAWYDVGIYRGMAAWRTRPHIVVEYNYSSRINSHIIHYIISMEFTAPKPIQCKAAVAWAPNEPLRTETITVDPPKVKILLNNNNNNNNKS